MKARWVIGLCAAAVASIYLFKHAAHSPSSIIKQTASAPPSALAWPLDCYKGEDCLINIGYPDVDRDGKDFDCKPVDIPSHEGTDIGISHEAMSKGVNVYAAADGVVQWAFDGNYDKCPSDHPSCQAPSSAMRPGIHDGYMVCTESGPYCKNGQGSCFWCFYGGNVVVIKHEPTSGIFATRYDHLRLGSIRVRPGERVKKGQVIGLVGSAGKSTGPHLHFEIWKSTYYDPYDPWSGQCHGGDSGLWPFSPGGPYR